MRLIVFSLLFAISTVAMAEVKYRSVTPLMSKGAKSFRDTWDATGQFCFKAEGGEKSCFKIAGMGEVKLRDGGQWSADTAVSALSPELHAAGEDYDRIFVRYLALDGVDQFAVHIFFLNKGAANRSSRTIFAFGKYSQGGVELTGMSFSSPLEEFGAMIWASRALLDQKGEPAEQAIKARIVETYLPLLEIGRSVVNGFLSGGSGPARRLP